MDRGGAAGFAMPVLRYYVGTGGDSQVDEFNAANSVLAPRNETQFTPAQIILFSWPRVAEAKYYRLEIADMNDAEVFSAILLRDTSTYSAPAGLFANGGNKALRWRVTAFGAGSKPLSETPLRTLRRALE